MAKLPTDIKALARVHTDTALRTLAKIMTTEDAPPAARVAAAQCLLDRGWGKAAQFVEVQAEVATKVIRTPNAIGNAQAWLDQHKGETLQ